MKRVVARGCRNDDHNNRGVLRETTGVRVIAHSPEYRTMDPRCLSGILFVLLLVIVIG